MTVTSYIISGKPRAGKDTLIGLMQDICTERGEISAAFSSIDPIKEMVSWAGINIEKKTEADRKLLSVIGDAVEEHSHYRTNYCLAKLETYAQIYSRKEVNLFFQLREPVLINKLRSMIMAKGFACHRVLVSSKRALDIQSNASDAGANGISWDYLVLNDDSILDLRNEAMALLNLSRNQGGLRHGG